MQFVKHRVILAYLLVFGMILSWMHCILRRLNFEELLKKGVIVIQPTTNKLYIKSRLLMWMHCKIELRKTPEE